MTIFGPDEFKEFVESKEAPVSSRWRDLQDLAFAQNPSSVSVLLNLLLVHILSSLITLTICPQLGVGFGGQGLRHWYMMLGHTVCEILCGITYFSVTSMVGWLFLPLSHRRWVARRPVLVSATLVSMTVVALGFMSAAVWSTMTLFWLGGALFAIWVGIRLFSFQPA